MCKWVRFFAFPIKQVGILRSFNGELKYNDTFEDSGTMPVSSFSCAVCSALLVALQLGSASTPDNNEDSMFIH